MNSVIICITDLHIDTQIHAVTTKTSIPIREGVREKNPEKLCPFDKPGGGNTIAGRGERIVF